MFQIWRNKNPESHYVTYLLSYIEYMASLNLNPASLILSPLSQASLYCQDCTLRRSQHLSLQALCNPRGRLHLICLASGQPSVGTQGCRSASQSLNSLCPQLPCTRGSQRIGTFLFVSTNFPDLSFSSSKRNRDHVGNHPKNALVSRGQCSWSGCVFVGAEKGCWAQISIKSG